jgi:hypothetical protein
MKLIVEFDSMEEFEQFRVSGKATRKRTKDEVEETATEPARQAAPPPQPAPAVQPISTPPDVQQAMTSGFPGGNGQMAPVVNPIVAAIHARIDGAVSTGQSVDDIVKWFRQQIGPEAAQATLDQIRNIFIPRMTEIQLKQLAPQLGIPTG